MNLIVTWKNLAIRHINGKYNLTPILTDKQMKLSSLKNQTQKVFSIHLLNLVRMILLNALILHEAPFLQLINLYQAHLEYEDILYDKLDNENFQKNKFKKNK